MSGRNPREAETEAERHTVSVRLPAESHRRLRVAAAEKGISMGAMLAALWEEELASRTAPKGAVDKRSRQVLQ